MRVMRVAWRLFLGLWSVLPFGCGAGLPQPSFAPQPTQALVQVPFPPPPARVEEIPDAPQEDAVWIDGEWAPGPETWVWRLGRWVLPPPNASWSPWVTVRDPFARLYFAPGTWRGPSGEPLPEPAPLAIARARGITVVYPTGEPFDPGPNRVPGREAPAVEPFCPPIEESP